MYYVFSFRPRCTYFYFYSVPYIYVTADVDAYLEK